MILRLLTIYVYINLKDDMSYKRKQLIIYTSLLLVKQQEHMAYQLQDIRHKKHVKGLNIHSLLHSFGH